MKKSPIILTLAGLLALTFFSITTGESAPPENMPVAVTNSVKAYIVTDDEGRTIFAIFSSREAEKGINISSFPKNARYFEAIVTPEKGNSSYMTFNVEINLKKQSRVFDES